MQETIEQMSTQITDKWNNLSKKQKIRLGVSIGCILIALIAAVFLFSRPKYEVILRNIESQDVAAAAEVLDNAKITYQVIDDGHTIQVIQQDVVNAKLALTRENIPKGGYTFEDAINNSMSTTESERKAKMQQLNEVELERALMSMDAISFADVKLVIPEEKNSFIASKQESSASVLLTLNYSQNKKQIEGIARFVSSSVVGLKMTNINIIDSEGNTLYAGGEDQGITTNEQQEIKSVAEKEINSKVFQILEPIYDEVRISSNLILDFDKREELHEEYTPQFEEDGRGIIHIEKEQSSSGTTGQSGAEPGVEANNGQVPTYQIGNGTVGESSSNSKEIEYVNNKVVSTIVKNQGDIDYKNSTLAVHVFKNKVYKQEDIQKTLDENMTWEMFKEANKENIAIEVDDVIVDSVKYGTGIDNVVVYGYEKPIFVDTEPYEINLKDYLPFVLIVLIIAVVVLALFKFRKHDEVVETEPELEVEEMLTIAKQDVEKQEQLEEIELKETLETKRQIEKFVDEKPEAVANLLRNWLTEDGWE